MKRFALTSPWSDTNIAGDPLLFIQERPDEAPSSSLLLEPAGPVTIESADRSRVYVEGRDWRRTANAASRRIELPDGSRIPFVRREELYPAADSPTEHKIPHLAGDPRTCLLFGEGHFFHDMQCATSYTAREAWTAAAPRLRAGHAPGGLLPRTEALLARHAPLTVALCGDSISAGGNASAFIGVPPWQPPFAWLFTEELERRHGGEVRLLNYAVGGWTSLQGAEVIGRTAEARPDLTVIAFGMNDSGSTATERFSATIDGMRGAIRRANPAAEYILVSPMLPNLEWEGKRLSDFHDIRKVLLSMEEPGTAMADCTSLWESLLQRKRFCDVTGNGVNHPNDFGHRLYAAALLSLLQ